MEVKEQEKKEEVGSRGEGRGGGGWLCWSRRRRRQRLMEV